MDRQELDLLIGKLRKGKKIHIDGHRQLNNEEKNYLADCIEDNDHLYLNNDDYPDEDSVLSDAIEGFDARDSSWMFDKEYY